MLRTLSWIIHKPKVCSNVLFCSRPLSLTTANYVRGKDTTQTLLPFGEIEGDVSNAHLNPTLHRELMEAPLNLPDYEESKLLKVCVLGVPNVGKSTLINRLVEANACPFSAKAHTTRKASNAIMTINNIQVVFCDTPGVVKPDDIKKFRFEHSLINDPTDSAKAADLIIVLQGTYLFANPYMSFFHFVVSF